MISHPEELDIPKPNNFHQNKIRSPVGWGHQWQSQRSHSPTEARDLMGKPLTMGSRWRDKKNTRNSSPFWMVLFKRKWIIIWYSNLSILEVKFFLFWESPKAPKTKRPSAQTWESWRNRLHMTSSPQQNRRPKNTSGSWGFVSSGRLGALQVWMLSNFLWQRWSSALGHQCWLVPGGCQHPMLWDLMLLKFAM